MFVDILHNGPRNGNAVVRTRATSEFIKKHQTAIGHIVENIRSLAHLHHESGIAGRNIIRSSDARKDLVHDADTSTFSRNKTSDLSHQRDQCRLSQQCRFTGHIRSGDNEDLLLLVVQIDVVGNVRFAHGKLFLDHRMTTLMNVDDIVVFHSRTDVSVFLSRFGEGEEAVETSDELRIEFDGLDIIGQSSYEIRKQLCLEGKDTILGTENLLLIFLQFFGNITFGIDQCLLADPFSRHFVLL